MLRRKFPRLFSTGYALRLLLTFRYSLQPFIPAMLMIPRWQRFSHFMITGVHRGSSETGHQDTFADAGFSSDPRIESTVLVQRQRP